MKSKGSCFKVGDNISTDHIVPSDSKLLPYRSNVPHLAKFSFCKVDDQSIIVQLKMVVDLLLEEIIMDKGLLVNMRL